MKGLFITVEGTDGAGKSTQIQLLTDYLKSKGRNVILKREPGGTDISEKIRELILDVNNKEMSDVAEALLYAASRAQLVHQVIKPALDKGEVVICDRFVDSSIVYQGIARGLGKNMVEEINRFAIDGIMPDITLFFDLSPEIGIIRKMQDQKLDRMESEKLDFHLKVYEGYKTLTNMYSDRIRRIDANMTIEEVHKQVLDAIKDFIK